MSTAVLGCRLGLTTAGDGLVERVAAAKYLITQNPPAPPPLAVATPLACAATAAAVFDCSVIF